MAFITNCGALINNGVNRCRFVPQNRFPETKLGIACRVADFLLGLTGVVLGILALLKILPIPPSMTEPFGYGAITACGLNLLTSMVREAWSKTIRD